MKCPICDKENRDLRCPLCGYDYSRNYEKYPTFGTPVRTPAVSTLRRQWQARQNPPAPKKPPQSAPVKIEKPIPSAPVWPKTPPQSVPPRPVPTAPPKPKQPEPAVLPADVPPQKNKWVALLLCFFLGMFGAHKFYEGKPGMGLLYLCTMGIGGYGWLFDCVALLFKPNPYTPSRRK